MNNGTRIESLSPVLKLRSVNPSFERVNSIPDGLSTELELAVLDFIKSSHVPEGVDLNGFYHQTLQSIANAAVLNAGGDLWLGILDGHLVSYVLGHIGNDYDGRLSYTVTQGWVRKDQRGKPWVKAAWQKVRERAKSSFCKHFAILSSRRNDAAYCRFLGKGFKKYASILKEEI